MSRPPDALDERIRASLGRTPSVAFDADIIVPGIRKRASARRRRQFAAGAAASTLALVLFVVGLNLRADPKVTVVTKPPPTTVPSSTVLPDYPFRELPLSDEPLADIPLTPVMTVGEHSLLVEVSGGKLSYSVLLNGEDSSRLHPADPETMQGIMWSAGSASQRANDSFHGIARSEVDHFLLTSPDQEIRVNTIGLDGIPQVRFFLIEAPPGTFTDRSFDVVAYDRDGTILTVDQAQPRPTDDRVGGQ
jgi:hypothetical protein